MHTPRTLFLTLSALVVSSRGRPSYDPSAPVGTIGGVFAGAPSDGSYPDDMEDASGWTPEAYAPVHDTPTDAVVVSTSLPRILVRSIRTVAEVGHRIPQSPGRPLLYVSESLQRDPTDLGR